MAKDEKKPKAKKTAAKKKPSVKKKPLTANTQHNDFAGTIALDGRIGSTTTLEELAKLCNVPADHQPVGFYLRGTYHPDGVADFEVAAVKGTIDDVVKYMNDPEPKRKLVVKMFGGKINLNDLGKYFKMLSIAVRLKRLEGRKVEYDPSKSVYPPD